MHEGGRLGAADVRAKVEPADENMTNASRPGAAQSIAPACSCAGQWRRFILPPACCTSRRLTAFLPIVPDFVPFPRQIVILTGICEIAGAGGLLSARLRRLAGQMLALYAICVFPANIKHAFGGVHVAGLPGSWAYHGPRLALQPVLVWWALFASGAVNWPFASKAAPGPKRAGAPRPDEAGD